MFYKIAIILAILWLLGVVTSCTMGGLIHALLLAAIVMVVVNLVTGRKPAVVRKDNAQDVY